MAQVSKWFRCSIAGCDNPGPYTRGWCSMHYTRWTRHGDPLVSYPRRYSILNLGLNADTDECVCVPASSGHDRPVVKFAGRRMLAARAIWLMAHGDPGDSKVLHRCNGGSGIHGCINIRHLYLGTPAQNIKDMLIAGRGRYKLTVEQVIEIRRLFDTGSMRVGELARIYGVCHATLGAITRRESWKHI